MKKEIHPESYRFCVFKDMSTDFAILTKSCAETEDTITWEDGDLKLDGESLTPRYPKSNLAFKNMLHDFYKGLNCSYSESIGWIIKSVEDCYRGYYPITDLTQ